MIMEQTSQQSGTSRSSGSNHGAQCTPRTAQCTREPGFFEKYLGKILLGVSLAAGIGAGVAVGCATNLSVGAAIGIAVASAIALVIIGFIACFIIAYCVSPNTEMKMEGNPMPQYSQVHNATIFASTRSNS